MQKLSIGLLAAVVIALAAAPAEAAKKKSGGKKGKAEVSKTVERNPIGEFGCFLSGMAGTKAPGPACGR
jgi:hypothetical protein